MPSDYAGKSHKVNAKASLNFKVAKDLLLYATFSQGFRDVGINTGLSPSCYANGAPAYYKPDTLNNFEIGWKSTLLDGHMTWNGELYYMPWKGYQTPVFDLAICPSGFNANLGDAHIYGAESNVDYKITEGLSVQVSGSYNDSHLISNTYQNPDYVVVPGERLPYVPYFSYSANARYEKPIGPELKGYVQYDIAHKGDMWSDLRVSNPNGFARSLQPAYAISNLRFGIQAPNERWTAEAYIANLLNEDAVIFTNTGRPPTSLACLDFGSATAGATGSNAGAICDNFRANSPRFPGAGSRRRAARFAGVRRYPRPPLLRKAMRSRYPYHSW